MLLLGHLGVGLAISALFRAELPKRWILLGAALPDLIDKPLYYSLCWLTGKGGAELGLFSGTRTIGHSGLFLLAFLAWGLARGSIRALAIAAGLLTHLALDLAGDPLELFDRSATVRAVLFPFLGFEFWEAPARRTMLEHLSQRTSHNYVVSGEVVGTCLLIALALFYRSRRKRGTLEGPALRRPES